MQVMSSAEVGDLPALIQRAEVDVHAHRVSAKRQRLFDAGYQVFGVRIGGMM